MLIWAATVGQPFIVYPLGAKIHQSGGKTRCIERGGVNYTLEDSSDIPEPIASCHQHSMEGLRKCKDIESVITGLEKQSSNGTYFPVTVGRRPPASLHAQQHWPPKSDHRKRRKSSSSSNRSPSSMSTMCQTSPSVLQLSDNIQVGEHIQLECVLVKNFFKIGIFNVNFCKYLLWLFSSRCPPTRQLQPNLPSATPLAVEEQLGQVEELNKGHQNTPSHTVPQPPPLYHKPHPLLLTQMPILW